MGATNVYLTFDLNKISMNEVKVQWNEEVEQSIQEDGCSYSGGVGMFGKGFSLLNHVSKDRMEAADYIRDKHQKWDGAMGVKTEDNQIVIGGWASC